jgi:hypothetical protein
MLPDKFQRRTTTEQSSDSKTLHLTVLTGIPSPGRIVVVPILVKFSQNFRQSQLTKEVLCPVSKFQMP